MKQATTVHHDRLRTVAEVVEYFQILDRTVSCRDHDEED
jgi:hypothetical protein